MNGQDSQAWRYAKGENWARHLVDFEALLEPPTLALSKALKLSDVSTCSGTTHVADLGCGGGGSTFRLARLNPSAKFHGFDISKKLIEEARKSRVANTAFDVADIAEEVPGRLFHRLTSRFGIMFFPEPKRAFTNLKHWLKRGGSFAFAVWGAPPDNPWATVVKEVVSEFVDVAAKEADSPGLFRYGNVQLLIDELERAGFSNVEAETWSGELPIGRDLDATEAARFALAAFSIAAPLKTAEARTQSAAKERLTEALRPHELGGVVRMKGSVHLVTGTR